MSFAKNSEGTLEVTDTNNYYPFGLNHISGIFSTSGFGSYYSYKYNGKELQETGMFDYGARMYMPDLGRWGVIDPLAEASRRFTPYHYGNNNPIRFIDPDGRLTVDNLQGGYSTGSAVANFMQRTGMVGNEQDMPLFYRNEGGMMIRTEALGNDGQGGGGGLTIGNIMEEIGIELTGDISSYMKATTALNLRQQLIDAGFTTPEKIKAMYNQKDALLKKVPALANIYKYFTKETPIEFQEGGTDAPGQLLSSTNIVALNMDKIDNILHLSFTLGHEMLHLYDSYFVNRSLREYFGNGTVGTSAILLYNEYRSYSWMVSLGYKTKSGNDLNIFNIIKFGYADKLNTDKSELGTKAYNLFLEKYNFLDSIYKLP